MSSRGINMNEVECARKRKSVSANECADIICNTDDAYGLIVCRKCKEGEALQSSVSMQGSAPQSEGGIAIAETEVLTAFHRVQAAAGKPATADAAPSTPADIRAFTDAELWAELHRRHPGLWKKM